MRFLYSTVTCCLLSFRTRLWKDTKLNTNCLNITSASKSRGLICRCTYLCLPPFWLSPHKSYRQARTAQRVPLRISTLPNTTIRTFTPETNPGSGSIRQPSATTPKVRRTSPLPHLIPFRCQPLTPSTLTSQHNTRTSTTSLLLQFIAQFLNIQTTSTMYQLPRVTPLIIQPSVTLCYRFMSFHPQATTPCNLPCPSPNPQALSQTCCCNQPSNCHPYRSLTQLSLSLSIQNSQLRLTTQPPTLSTASLQLPTRFSQVAEDWRTTQPI